MYTKQLRAVLFSILLLCVSVTVDAQYRSVQGAVTSGGKALEGATIKILPGNLFTISDSLGFFSMDSIALGSLRLTVTAAGFQSLYRQLAARDSLPIEVSLEPLQENMDEVVITGTLKEVKRLESPVPVEVYSPSYFRKNPTPNIFDALQNVNGVRPQLNCSVCNTGDIHINGLEGPYTMVLIDGMPIVSSLSTVYGLSGIPNSLVERIEIVKGPASSLYGSEAVGGLINIITKSPGTAPRLMIDVFATSWQELNVDLSFKMNAGKKATVLTGINYFKYGNIKDVNRDGFTDVTLQDRVSVFQKWNFYRDQNRSFNIAARYFYEDRWGGDTRWTKAFRGGDSIYGENIYTSRWELLGNYQLPVKGKILFSFSYNDHDQDSRYGTTSYIARQQISFGQLTWDKKIAKHDMLLGAALRHTFYDDNSPATARLVSGKIVNHPDRTWLPGIFAQDEITISARQKLLLGFRYDYNSVHGNIYTPRLAYKYNFDDKNILRLNMGTGYRVVNIFTEDHAALTGAREVVIRNELKPERTYNVNLNFLKKIFTNSGVHINTDITAWYTFFNNRIIGNYDISPDSIIYDNLKGYAISKGVSANLDVIWPAGIKLMAGVTFQDVSTIEGNVKTTQILTEKFSGTWALSYNIKRWQLSIDYTGNVYGPMRLPLLGSLDPRMPRSPTWSLQNIQFTYKKLKKTELYAGVKNILNFTPNKGNPFIIARSKDPFDKEVQYDTDGKILATANNPYALSFDPTYVFAPNQGIRCFVGARFTIK